MVSFLCRLPTRVCTTKLTDRKQVRVPCSISADSSSPDLHLFALWNARCIGNGRGCPTRSFWRLGSIFRWSSEPTQGHDPDSRRIRNRVLQNDRIDKTQPYSLAVSCKFSSSLLCLWPPFEDTIESNLPRPSRSVRKGPVRFLSGRIGLGKARCWPWWWRRLPVGRRPFQQSPVRCLLWPGHVGGKQRRRRWGCRSDSGWWRPALRQERRAYAYRYSLGTLSRNTILCSLALPWRPTGTSRAWSKTSPAMVQTRGRIVPVSSCRS